MEDTLDVPISSGAAPNEEKSDGSIVHEEDCTQGASKEDELESAKAEMSEVRNENARLKMMLQQIEKDYKSLKNRFIDIFEQETKRNINNDHSEESELVSLRLGRSANEFKKDDTIIKTNKRREDGENKDGLKLGLECNLGGFKSDRLELRLETSPENSLGETKKEEAGTRWPPSEELKSSSRSGEDELSEQPSVKRARVSVRARCDTPTMHDGCQWRKYGQKIAKGNPCPRAYYRCTVAPACPVRKQVQRCAEDMSILTTTYEGTHNHPLPISATAMASTTSAAASMLLSGSSTAQTASQSANLHGLNVNLLSDNSRTRPFYLPNTPPPNFPTITLDLTTSSSSHYNMFSPSFQSTPKFPSQSLNFSSSETNMVPTVWGSGYLGQGTLPYNKTPIGSLNLGRPTQELFCHPYMEKNSQGSSQQPLTESLTRAITADPSFRSAIEAAISSLVGNGGAAQGNQGGGESFGHHLK